MEYKAEVVEDVTYTKSGKVRKRKPKTKNVYFTIETEEAILEYVSEVNQVRRNRIYNEKIHYAFYKLVENIIHTFKFYYTEVDDIEDLKHEVISFIIQKLHLFNHSKYVNDRLNNIVTKEFKEEYENNSFITYTNGSASVTKESIDEYISTMNVSEDCKKMLYEIYPPKAYSYFGTVAKRYLIIYNKKNYKKLLSQTQINDIDEEEDTLSKLADYPQQNGPNRITLIDDFIHKMDSSLLDIFTTDDDIRVAHAILEVFRKRENIDIFNKKALFLYVKEITDTNSNNITKVIKVMKKVYTSLLNDRIDNFDD